MAIMKLSNRPEVFVGTIFLLVLSASFSCCFPAMAKSEESLVRFRRQQPFDGKDYGAIVVAMKVTKEVMVRVVQYI